MMKSGAWEKENETVQKLPIKGVELSDENHPKSSFRGPVELGVHLGRYRRLSGILSENFSHHLGVMLKFDLFSLKMPTIAF